MAARAASDWKELGRLWGRFHHHAAFDDHPAAIAAYLDVPEQARRRHPVLTWARAIAISQQHPARERVHISMREVHRDGLVLHAQWRPNHDSDTSVYAGLIWLSSLQTGSSGVEHAWTVRNAIADSIREFREKGVAPSPTAVALFHLDSSQLAARRGDLEAALSEANLSLLARDEGPTARLAAALKALILALRGVRDPDRPVPASGPDPAGMAAIAAKLSCAIWALRALDPQALGILQGIDLTGEPGWPVRVSLLAVAEAFWVDPESALLNLEDRILANSLRTMEHREPLGHHLIHGARALILCLMHRPAASLAILDRLGHPWDWGPRGMALLWTGDLEAALHTARQGLFTDSGTSPPDRGTLQVVIAAALATKGTSGPALEAALDRAQEVPSLVPFAILPQVCREALVDALRRPGRDAPPPEWVAQVNSLATSTRGRDVLIRLTRRERELLPLLASEASVPQIAAQLHLAVSTVRKEVATLRVKFRASSRAELLRRAREGGHLS